MTRSTSTIKVTPEEAWRIAWAMERAQRLHDGQWDINCMHEAKLSAYSISVQRLQQDNVSDLRLATDCCREIIRSVLTTSQPAKQQATPMVQTQQAHLPL